VHCTKISPEFEFGSQRSKVKGQGHQRQTRKSAAFLGEAVLGGRELCRVVSVYDGGKISACCLV